MDSLNLPAAAPAERTAAMRFIMLTVLIDMVAIGLMIPVLPALVGTFTASPAEQVFWYGAVTFAFGIWLMAVKSAKCFVGEYHHLDLSHATVSGAVETFSRRSSRPM